MNQFPIVVDFSSVNWNQFTKLFWFLSQFASSKRFIGKKSFQTAKPTASSPISRLPQRIDKNVIKLRRSRQIYIWWFSDEQLLGFCVVNVKLFYDYFIHPRDMMCCYGNHSNVLDKLHFAVQMRRVLARSQQVEQKEVFIAVSVEWSFLMMRTKMVKLSKLNRIFSPGCRCQHRHVKVFYRNKLWHPAKKKVIKLLVASKLNMSPKPKLVYIRMLNEIPWTLVKAPIRAKAQRAKT